MIDFPQQIFNWAITASDDDLRRAKIAINFVVACRNHEARKEDAPTDSKARRAWTKAEESKLRLINWKKCTEQEKQEHAEKFGRTVAACNYKWHQLAGLWK